MNLDSFLIRIVILVLPGFAGLKTFRYLRSSGKSKKHISEYEDLLNIVLFSFFTYFILNKILLFLTITRTSSILEAFLDTNIKINYLEILLSLILASILGLLMAFISNKKVLYRFFQYIKVTNHYGEEDVWSYMLGSDNIFWVNVRDHMVDLVYYGSVLNYSESGEIRELILGNVDVYNAQSDHLYSVEALYLCRKEYELSIELISPEKNRKKE